MEDSKFYERMTSEMKVRRGIRHICETCGGFGKKYYGNTSTWLYGVGGAMVVLDVCDVCWGSGDNLKKGVNLKKMRRDIANLKEEVKKYKEKYGELEEEEDGIL